MADPDAFRRRLDRIYQGKGRTAVDQLLSRGQPIHFGGMTDPFMPPETEEKISLRLLQALAEFDHPTVISTKGTLYASDDYLEVLTRGRFMVQASVSSMDEELVGKVDLDAPAPTARLEALQTASAAGVPTSFRIQPVLPSREADAADVIRAASEVNARHVSVEHLKLPIEGAWPGTRHLSSALGFDVRAAFQEAGATRVGREWVLPLESRLDTVLSLRAQAQRAGLSFGAADTDLLLLSDGSCCCSGADHIPGFSNFHRYTFTEAARRGLPSGKIVLSSISDVPPPEESIGEFLNSRSRLPDGAGVGSYVRKNWNGRPNGQSPAGLAGVVTSDERDDFGNRIYSFEPWVRDLLSSPD